MKQLSRGDFDATRLSGTDRLVYDRALEALRPWGVLLDSAAIEHTEAHHVFGGFSIAQAAPYFVRDHGRGIRSKAVADAVDEMIANKAAKGVSKLYLDDLRYRLGTFRKSFSCDVNSIAPDDVRAWMDALNLSPRSYNNFLRTLGTFFAFAQGNGWLSKDIDLLASVDRMKASLRGWGAGTERFFHARARNLPAAGRTP